MLTFRGRPWTFWSASRKWSGDLITDLWVGLLPTSGPPNLRIFTGAGTTLLIRRPTRHQS